MHKEFKGIPILLTLIALFLIVRFLVLFSSLDKIYEPEELYRGTIAREIIKGPVMPLWDYLDYKTEYFSGGVLSVGILAVPFFLLFGQTYLALKLVGFSFSLATFILWYLFLNRFFSKKAAIICALLFIFSMPFYVKTSLITWGQHPEANFFGILSMLIFFTIFFKKEEDAEDLYRANKVNFFIWGLTAGIGAWFVHTYLFYFFSLFLFWFVFDKGFMLRKVFFVFCSGFLAGFLPAIYYAFFKGGAIFNINGHFILAGIIGNELKLFLPKLIRLLSFDLPKSFIFKDLPGIKGDVFSYLYYFIFIIAFICLLWRNREGLLLILRNIIYPITLKEVKAPFYRISGESIILAQLFIFLMIYSLSAFSVSPDPWDNQQLWLDYIGYRYMIPIIPFIFVIIGIFLTSIKDKKVFYALLCLAVGLGIIGNINLVSLRKLNWYKKDKGYSYAIIGDKLGLRFKGGFKERLKPFEKLDQNSKLQFYEGIGTGIAWRLKEEGGQEIVRNFEEEVSQQYWPYLYRGWGLLFAFDTEETLYKISRISISIPKNYRKFFYEGIGRATCYSNDINTAISLINKVKPEYRPYCYLGMGYWLGFYLKNEAGARLDYLAKVPMEYRKFAYQGIPLGMEAR